MNSFFKQPNIKLFVDGIEYLQHYSDTASTKTYVPGGYYGASTRTPGGEIWHPETGYKLLKITLIIKLDDKNWTTVFDEVVNFQEHILEIFKAENERNFETYVKICNPSPTELEEMERINREKIDEMLSGKSCEVNESLGIVVKNDRCKLTLYLRELYRFEGEVQISSFSYELI